MLVEIDSWTWSKDKKNYLTIEAHSVEDCELQRIERNRVERLKEVYIRFDLNRQDDKDYLFNFLKSQKIVKKNIAEIKTLGDALRAVLGTVVNVNKRYISYQAIA